MFFLLFDLMMDLIMLLLGMGFYKSNGKAADYLSGYNSKSEEERKSYKEKAMSEAYGKRMMFMALPFIAGAVIDIFYQGIGCTIAWLIWCFMFALLLIRRHITER